MELIPILSTIILVATISTFLLAIGAYILYKVREAKGQQVAVPAPSTIKAELITPMEESSPLIYEEPGTGPQPAYIEHPQQYQPSAQPVYPVFSNVRNYQTPPPPVPKQKSGPKFMKYTEEGYTPTEAKKEDKSNGALRWK